jgi:preprotein translocase subunit SecA
MINKVNKDVVGTLMKGHIPIQSPDQVRQAEERKRTDMSKYKTQKSDMPGVQNPNAGCFNPNYRTFKASAGAC